MWLVDAVDDVAAGLLAVRGSKLSLVVCAYN
jgi:hypothetical protein